MPNLKPTKKAPLKKQAPMRLTEKSFISKFTALETSLHKYEVFISKRNRELAEKFATENLKLKIGIIYKIDCKTNSEIHNKRFVLTGFRSFNIHENIVISVSGFVEPKKIGPKQISFFTNLNVKTIPRGKPFRNIKDISILKFAKLTKSINQKKFN
jgi:hypothetical protein